MILTPEDICKAVGARAASERWLKDAAAIESALLEKLRGGVEVPKQAVKLYDVLGQTVEVHGYTLPQLLAYGAAQRLAGQQRESCTWTEQDDKDMPGT